MIEDLEKKEAGTGNEKIPQPEGPPSVSWERPKEEIKLLEERLNQQGRDINAKIEAFKESLVMRLSSEGMDDARLKKHLDEARTIVGEYKRDTAERLKLLIAFPAIGVAGGAGAIGTVLALGSGSIILAPAISIIGLASFIAAGHTYLNRKTEKDGLVRNLKDLNVRADPRSLYYTVRGDGHIPTMGQGTDSVTLQERKIEDAVTTAKGLALLYKDSGINPESIDTHGDLERVIKHLIDTAPMAEPRKLEEYDRDDGMGGGTGGGVSAATIYMAFGPTLGGHR
ncbi:MAG: hypothetical protein AAB947_00945 [Patescibacteria group bacterium]